MRTPALVIGVAANSLAAGLVPSDAARAQPSDLLYLHDHQRAGLPPEAPRRVLRGCRRRVRCRPQTQPTTRPPTAYLSCRANCPPVPSRRRWESEWQGGHVVNATHIPGLQDLSGDVVPSQLLGCTACNIVLYCASGYRSKQAADKLASLGFTGGLYDGLGIQQWQERHVQACGSR